MVDKKNDLYLHNYQKIHYSLQFLCLFYFSSPSICHSDSDLSDGSRKYSPSSETSVETQRACGKRDIIIKHENLHAFIHMQSHTQIGAHAHKLADSAGNWLTHFTNVLPDVLFKVFCHTNKRLIIWTTVSVCIFLHFLCCYRRRKQLFTHQLIHFFPPLFSPPACLSQEASPRRTPLCVTIMASAARRKCSG